MKQVEPVGQTVLGFPLQSVLGWPHTLARGTTAP
jgi:hypothetical protein